MLLFLLLPLVLLFFAVGALAFLGYLLLMVFVSAAAGAWTRPQVGWHIAAATIGLPLVALGGVVAVIAG
ncbi:hypothetical protein H9Y04_32110 [Streptomyces sp. TRM66268-LWL]|uniref:Uncharacterized protein n=1 Tax=Streptomyces polyasparticus TaxID=2767826 RepID=A0ABR7SP97_9ACTN|nr:hypothetical protein [Streptomyces polyasparticus]MBC9717184.1 hypothetical protein [Streptomyces polyasparticus]